MARKQAGSKTASPATCPDDGCEELHLVENEVEHFKEWQINQNGSLKRIEDKVDKLMWRIPVAMGSVILALIGLILEEALKH